MRSLSASVDFPANSLSGVSMTSNRLEPAYLEQLRKFDSCTIANAIETFGVRLRNSGFTDSRVHCMFDDFSPMVGYAATINVRTSLPPMEGESYYYRLDWLEHVLSIPAPRILVMQDSDRHPGLGSFIGDVHANILRALGCIGVVTNGAVRNITSLRAMQFHTFAGNLSVSHAFAHVFDFGQPVEVSQMQVRPGDLLHGDRHGVQTVPLEIAENVAVVAQRMMEEEREIIELCRSDRFSLDALRSEVKTLGAKRKESKG
jgi:regulator of RNase E activity RraA